MADDTKRGMLAELERMIEAGLVKRIDEDGDLIDARIEMTEKGREYLARTRLGEEPG